LLVIIAIAGAIFLLRGLMSKLKNGQIFIGNVNQESELQPALLTMTPSIKKAPQIFNDMRKKKELLPLGDLEDDISDEAINKKNRQEKISNYVSKNPTEAAKLINAWLHEDE